MKPDDQAKVTGIIGNSTSEETHRTVFPSREVWLQSTGVSLDDCARQAMMELGLPKVDMSEVELAQFNQKQSTAIALAKRNYRAATE